MNNLSDRELDARIAEKVMGLVPCEGNGHANGDLLPCHAQPDSPTQGGETHCYSTDISAAMEVEDRIEVLKLEREYAAALARLVWNAYASTEVNLMHWQVAHASPRMRCEAALKAVETDAR